MIKAKTVESIESLITTIKKDYDSWKTTTYPWFRGEPANTPTPLLPRLYRLRTGKEPHSENRLLQQFRIKAPSWGLMNTPPRDHTDEWLFLAQHVGLPTRLLDWTEGLLIAVYFALKEKKPAIWMLDPVELNRRSSIKPIYDNDFQLTWFSPDKVLVTRGDFEELIFHLSHRPKEEDEKLDTQRSGPQLGNINIRGAWELDRIGTELPVSIHPTDVHVRMNTQKSCFTIQGTNKQSLSELVDSRILRKYVIPPKQIDSFTKDLRMIGFTHTSAFPDLDNLAKDLSEIF